MAMEYSKLGLRMTERFEELETKAYQDVAGVWTIGYGHTAGVKQGDTCTPEQAEEWLADDVAVAAACVNSCVTVGLTQPEFDALVDLVFNIGCGAFSRSTLLRELNSGDYAEAAKQFEVWDHAGGKEVAGLLRRRLAEEQEFNS